MARQPGRLTRMWLTDSGLTALLVLIVATVFMIEPLRTLGAMGQFLFGVMFSSVLVSGVLAVARSRLAVGIAGTLTLGSLAVHWLTLVKGGTGLEMADSVATLASLGLFAVLMVLQVFREGPITSHRIQGAVAVYLLIGMMWTFAYKLVVLAHPAAFTGLRPDGDFEHLSGDMLYFSFVTLTTLGYGDVTAVYPVARSLAILEALVGQLYPAILIARLVSMELFYRDERFAGRHTLQLRGESRESSEDRRSSDARETARPGEKGTS